MSDTQTSTHISQVGTVMVPVSDQDQAIAFYTEKLGLELRADVPFGNGDRWVEVAPAGAATTLALVTPRPGRTDRHRDAHRALDARTSTPTTPTCRARGVDVDDEVMRMGDPVPPMFFLRDHEGNKLLVVQTG